MISHGRSTYDEGRVCRHNRDSYHDIEALSDQMAAWIAKVDNKNNLNRGGKSIPVIRVINIIPTIVTYRKSKYSNESDLDYYERRYYTKLKMITTNSKSMIQYIVVRFVATKITP